MFYRLPAVMRWHRVRVPEQHARVLVAADRGHPDCLALVGLRSARASPWKARNVTAALGVEVDVYSLDPPMGPEVPA